MKCLVAYVQLNLNTKTFFRIWRKIQEEFNKYSRRSVPSTVGQLSKLASKIRSEARMEQDKILRGSNGMKDFKKKCSETGGGRAPIPPAGFDLDFH
jgi:hypothetical protein